MTGSFPEGTPAASGGAKIAFLPGRGVLRLNGKDALALLHRLSTNALLDLPPGAVRRSCLTTHKAKIVDRLVVLRRERDLLLLTGEERGDRVSAWLRKYALRDDLGLEDLSVIWRVALLFGPAADASFTEGAGMPAPGPGEIATIPVSGEEVLAVADDPVAGMSFLLAGPEAGLAILATRLTDAGVAHSDREEWDLARIESGVPSAGRELGEETNPLETGIEDSVSFTKGCFPGQEILARLRTYGGVTRGLSRLHLEGEGPPPPGTPVRAGGAEIGVVTSSARRPGEGSIAALALLKKAAASPGTEIEAGGCRGWIA